MYFTAAQKEVLLKHLRAGCNSRKECAEWRSRIGDELGGVETARVDRWFCNNRGLAPTDPPQDAPPPNLKSDPVEHPVRRRGGYDHTLHYSADASHPSTQYASHTSAASSLPVLSFPGKTHTEHSSNPHWQEYPPREKRPKWENNHESIAPSPQQRVVLPQLASREMKMERTTSHDVPPPPGHHYPPQRPFTLPSISTIHSSGSSFPMAPIPPRNFPPTVRNMPSLASSNTDMLAHRAPKTEYSASMHSVSPYVSPRSHFHHLPPTATSYSLPRVEPVVLRLHRPPSAPQPLQVTASPISPEATPRKKGKRTKKVPPPETEKRQARYRTVASQQTRDRIDRARRQRMYMIEKQVVSPLHQTFAVLGSTGNIYTVSIELRPACTCPDFDKGNLCKHILFVYLKCLRVDASSPVIFQKALLTTELHDIFESASRVDPMVVANQRVVAQYRAATQGQVVAGDDEEEQGAVQQKPLEGADCPICFEDLADGRPIVWCKTQCGNNFHKECFDQWKRSRRSSGVTLTCIYCRSPWEESKGKSKAANHADEGYLNLASVANLPRRRDSSSYSRWHRNEDY
ncbi:Aste57867_9016 [Aphanomyces stellatus]|uniref:Aste57867_9016 protein n=1 Tax=Aphanomyces stellatus TaxID=120398 RepID=A0A485KLY4_9STRA|nr:hypothetical protein As57867_008980 [Aphanomyces stellatus]VFT85900.1 Aste57867_9016 [Aphanomyces stellatus]